MALGPLTPRSVFRYFKVDGVPSSGKHEPIKAEIIQLLETLFGTSRGGWVVTRTLEELNGVVPEGETDGGVVLADPDPANNGYYERTGGEWVKGRGFPDTFARVELSGDSTAQVGEVRDGVNPADIEVFFAFVETENTGPMTLAIGGEVPREVMSLAGSPVSAGEWTGAVMFALRGDKYQLLLDAGAAQAAALEADRASDEADRAEAAAAIAQQGDGKGLAEFETRADAEAWPGVDPMPDSIVIRGDASVDDGMGGVFAKGLASADTMAVGGESYGRNTGVPITLTVGSDGRFSTINAAIAAASRLPRRDFVDGGLLVEVRLLTGFVMAEQVHVVNLDLSFITITSDEAIVPVDSDAITEVLLPLEDNMPLFCGEGGARLPVIGCLFAYEDNSRASDGVTVTTGSSVRFLSSDHDSAVRVSGVRNARKGLTVLSQSKAFCTQEGLTQGGAGAGAGTAVGVDFSGALMYAVHAQHGAHAVLTRSDFSKCEGSNAVYVIWASNVDIYQSDITGFLGNNAAVHARDASVLCARECDASNSAARGFHALHGAILDARSSIANNCVSYGYLANGVSFIDATGGAADDCGFRAVWASQGSTIEFSGGSAKNSLGKGVGAVGASTINASGGVDTSGAAEEGFFCEGASRVNAPLATANNCNIGFCALQGSVIEAQYGKADDCLSIGVLSSRGSDINFRDGSAMRAGTLGVQAFEGSKINARGSSASSASGDGYSVGSGSMISAQGAGGTKNQAANTLTAAGIIFG